MPGWPGFPQEKPADTMPINTQRPSACCTCKCNLNSWAQLRDNVTLCLFKITIKGPPESPLHESLPPSRYPAQTISGQIFTWKFKKNAFQLFLEKVWAFGLTWMPWLSCHNSHFSFVMTGTLATCKTLGLLTSGTRMLIRGPVTSSGIRAPQPAT